MTVTSARTSARRDGAIVAVATAGANALAYGLNVVVSRRLGPLGFGEVAPLLAVVLVASVPGQALQAGAARRAAAGSTATGRLLHQSLLIGAAVAVGLLLLAPGLRALLQLDGWAALSWTALSLLPLTFSFACYGVLQGSEQFGRLAVALVLVQVGRLVGGTVGTLAFGTAAAAMAGTAIGIAVAAAVCRRLVAPDSEPGPIDEPERWRSVVRDTTSVLVVVVLSNVDLLLARSRLSPSQAGLYAAGTLVAKVAFFAPSFVAVVLYPRLSRPADRPRALREAAVLLTASAAVMVGGAWAGSRLVTAVLGAAYAGLESTAWLFAAAGSALAAVYLLVQAGLAVRDHRLSVVAWAVAATEVVVILAAVSSLVQLVGVVVTGGCLLVGIGVLLERRTARAAEVEEEPQPAPLIAG